MPAHQSVMQDVDDWVALKDITLEGHGYNFRLKYFMEFLCKGHARFDKMQVSMATLSLVATAPPPTCQPINQSISKQSLSTFLVVDCSAAVHDIHAARHATAAESCLHGTTKTHVPLLKSC